MGKEENSAYIVDPVYKDMYRRGLTSYYDCVELECPECKKHYYSIYGSRFTKEGELKHTLFCKSCSRRRNSQKYQDPETGTIFGDLTFIRRDEDKVTDKGKRYIQYLCRCKCGSLVKVDKINLLKGASTKCTKCKTKQLITASNKRGQKTDPEIGTVFGNLTYLEKVYHKDKSGRNIQYYRCRCSCGNIIETNKSSVLKGLTTSCGCKGSRNTLGERMILKGQLSDPLIGSQFGKLTVLEINPLEKGEEKKILCKCSCGNTVYVYKNCLLSGHYKTCGHCPREYPDWLIERLIDPEQKKLALDHKVLPRRISILCSSCGKPTDVLLTNIINMKTQQQKRLGFCKKCSHQTSLQEKEIKDFLLSIGLSDSQIYTNTRKVIKNKETNIYRELDFYIPDYNLAIEYNGSYYHSEHKKPKDYHSEKFYLCEEKGIRLISIFEMDWFSSKDKLKDLIKYAILPKKRIPARKCNISHVSKQTAYSFYNQYHIQNKSSLAKINLGLYYNNELISVMGFGSSSFHNRNHNEGDYELHRFVTKTGYTVVGGASKLLKYFEEEYKPKFLLSYSWNDWFDGKLYQILGFTLDRKVPSDYYWYLNGECLDKRKCRLRFLQSEYPALYQEALDKQASNKEDYVMESLGAVKIYRSGSKRWVKRY